MEIERLQKEVSKLVKKLDPNIEEGMVNILRVKTDILPDVLKGNYDLEKLKRNLSSIQFALYALAEKYNIQLVVGVNNIINSGYQEENLDYLAKN